MQRLLTILAAFALAACATPTPPLSSAPAATRAAPTRIAVASPSATIPPTLTQTPTAHPPTATATSTLPPPPSPTLCPSSEAVVACNSQAMTTLVQIGRGAVRQIAISPDGQTLAAATGVGLTLYDAQTLAPKQYLPTPLASALTVAYSPDGRWLAAGLSDGVVQLWDAATLTPGSQLAGHTAKVNAVAWSPDSLRLASASDDATIKIWNVENSNEQNAITDFGHALAAVAWSPDGKLLAYGGDHDQVVVRDTASREFVDTIVVEWPSVTALGWSPDGEWLAIQDYTLQIWSRHNRKFDNDFGQLETASTFAWAPDSFQMLFASRGLMLFEYSDSTIRHLDQREPLPLLGHHREVQVVVTAAWSPDGKRLYTVDNYGVLEVFNSATGNPLVERKEQSGVSEIAWSWDSQWIATASGNIVRVWRASDGGSLRSITARYNVLGGMDWSLDGAEIAILSRTYRADSIQLFSGITDQELGSIDGFGEAVIGALMYKPAARPSLIAMSLWDSSIGLIDTEKPEGSWRILKGPDLPGSFMHPLQWSRDGQRIAAVGDGDNSQWVVVWDVESGEPQFDHPGSSATWSPDGRQLAIGSEDGWLQIWDTREWRIISTIVANGQPIRVLDWSRTGSLVATAGDSGAIQIWDVNTYVLLNTLQGHTDTITELAWSPDGTRLASASRDGTVRVWGVK